MQRNLNFSVQDSSSRDYTLWGLDVPPSNATICTLHAAEKGKARNGWGRSPEIELCMLVYWQPISVNNFGERDASFLQIEIFFIT